ncbi:UV DNA damage repair endonuclease UvsE [Simkania sp.]|uniref:UV DNA damage repair endonuclease UvsE n=1 Tax=Simkania sp. TaxID=34094 RepID=UPI003B524B40
MIRLGLCCIFHEEPIKFRTTTAAYLGRIEKPYDHLDTIVGDNIRALMEAMTYCVSHDIGSFRINSQFLPLCSHPDWKYTIADLPSGKTHLAEIEKCRLFREKQGLRLVLHPDQFVVLNSPKKDVVENSIAELTYHAMLADLLGIDVINIHGGGVYGNKAEALARLKSHYGSLAANIKERLTFENDDKSYTPADLLPICNELGAPFVYDVHHHRCLKDDMLIQEATGAALKTWNREPLFHISSPLEGWDGPKPQRHHDFIDPTDFPDCWENLNLTVEIEAKAKEVAIQKLQYDLKLRNISIWKAST